MMPVIDQPAFVVMATYNGAPWLREQLESIRQQTFDNWRLLVSDDGSNDGTVEILKEFARNDSRVTLLPDREGEKGHVANFEYLLRSALEQGAAVVFLADQDDVWQPDKLEILLQLLEFSGENCDLCFSDLEVVGADGAARGGYFDLMALKPLPSLPGLIGQNPIVGCSLAMRAAVLKLALPFPEGLENHDWWLALCAMVCGGLLYTEKRLVNYRQHGGNTIGIAAWSFSIRRGLAVIQRQNRILLSKLIAVETLVGRLQKAGLPVPEELYAYLNAFEGNGRWEICWQLVAGEFRPKSRALRAVQLIAVLTH